MMGHARSLDYSPRRITQLLSHLIGDYALSPAGTTESKSHTPAFPCASYEFSAMTRADLERGFRSVTQAQFLCILGVYLFEKRTDEVADILGISQAEVSQTIWAGLDRMARSLGWTPPRDSYNEQPAQRPARARSILDYADVAED